MASEAAGKNTVVGNGSVLEGSFNVENDIHVDGTLKGQLVSKGTLVVGASGAIEADLIQVREAVIAGRVQGNIEASGRVRLESTAELEGDVRAQILIIEEGAKLEGFCDVEESGSEENEMILAVDLDVAVNKAAG
mgnify:CR=1 FL=1